MISRKFLHVIHCVFSAPIIIGHNRDDPVSNKKLKQGEGLLENRNTILCWIFDGIERSLTLPNEKIDNMFQEFLKWGDKRQK